MAVASSGDRAGLIAKHQWRLDQAAEAVALVSLGACSRLSEADAWEATAFKPLADDGLTDDEIEEAAANAIRNVGPKMIDRLGREGEERVCGDVLAKFGISRVKRPSPDLASDAGQGSRPAAADPPIQGSTANRPNTDQPTYRNEY
jgi:hypothetical protein